MLDDDSLLCCWMIHVVMIVVRSVSIQFHLILCHWLCRVVPCRAENANSRRKKQYTGGDTPQTPAAKISRGDFWKIKFREIRFRPRGFF